jgi:hypothetical protein
MGCVYDSTIWSTQSEMIQKSIGAKRQTVPNRTANIGYNHVCRREENLSFNNDLELGHDERYVELGRAEKYVELKRDEM